MNHERYLTHFGILGQKWGIRRYQDKNGKLTPAGKKRYDSDSKFKNQVDYHATKEALKKINKNIDSLVDRKLKAQDELKRKDLSKSDISKLNKELKNIDHEQKKVTVDGYRKMGGYNKPEEIPIAKTKTRLAIESQYRKAGATKEEAEQITAKSIRVGNNFKTGQNIGGAATGAILGAAVGTAAIVGTIASGGTTSIPAAIGIMLGSQIAPIAGGVYGGTRKKYDY